mmetsp:Transcript_16579/g.42720  ORF Transcript_16579/g.42720 Transcript_16579/m.42720 type:complete len:109 (-) Transcript_16579:567-893(-)
MEETMFARVVYTDAVRALGGFVESTRCDAVAQAEASFDDAGELVLKRRRNGEMRVTATKIAKPMTSCFLALPCFLFQGVELGVNRPAERTKRYERWKSSFLLMKCLAG